MKLARTDKEIDAVLNRCSDLFDSGDNPWPGETYSEGVKNAVLWLTGLQSDNPMDE